MFASLDWPAFIVAMLAVELTPGPNMGWLATLSARAGREHGMKAVAGITLGLAIQLLAAATGLSALLAGSITLYEALRWGGVAFMLYLAWEAFRDDGSAPPAMANKLAGFRRGLIANLLNPKALVFYLLVVGQFADPRLGHLWLQILTLGSLHILLSLIVHVTIVLVADHLGGIAGEMADLVRCAARFWPRACYRGALDRHVDLACLNCPECLAIWRIYCRIRPQIGFPISICQKLTRPGANPLGAGAFFSPEIRQAAPRAPAAGPLPRPPWNRR
jgi:threonine/homoserine/homoserine lactone efflux protein